MQDLPGPPADRGGVLDRFAAAELEDIGVHSRRDRGQPVGVRVGSDRHDLRPMAGRRRRADQPGKGDAFVDLQGTGRAGREVEPDRIGAGTDRGQRPVRVRHAADLDHRPSSHVGRIGGRPARRDVGRHGRCRIRIAHQGLADQRPVEGQRAPAGDSSDRGRPIRR
jgi:hypothetical protein